MLDHLGNTPLHQAIKRGHLLAVRKLLEYKANACIPNKKGETPLHYAVQFKLNKEQDHPLVEPKYDLYPAAEMVQELFKNGAATTTEAADIQGNTPKDLAHDHIKPALISALKQLIRGQLTQEHEQKESQEPISYCP